MKVIRPSVEIIRGLSDDGMEELKAIELIGRSCYDSEDKITEDGESAKRFVSTLIKKGHESVLEHVSVTVKIICDRGISHELVRHRHCAFTQQSTRYCNFADEKKYPDGLVVIKPCYLDDNTFDFRYWWNACSDASDDYVSLIKIGLKPEQARAVLPTSTATKLYMTANLREWRSILKLRADKAAHPQMRDIMCDWLYLFKKRIPVVFDDIEGWK